MNSKRIVIVIFGLSRKINAKNGTYRHTVILVEGMHGLESKLSRDPNHLPRSSMGRWVIRIPYIEIFNKWLYFMQYL